MLKARTRDGQYIRSLCGEPKSHPYLWRSMGAFLLSVPVVYFTMALADGEHLPKFLVYALSPGYILGLWAMKYASGFSDGLRIFGETAFPNNLLY